MTKISLILLFIIFSWLARAQHEIIETDTTLNFKETFFTNGQLNVSPYYKYFDSTINMYRVVPKVLLESNIKNIDTTKILLLREGTWRIDYQKKRKKYYYLAQYKDDELIGKRYDFDSKGRLISTFKRYPRVNDSIFNGSQIIEYDEKGWIKSIEYIQFNEDQTPLFYWNTLRYNKFGVLVHYSFTDESQNKTRFITYSNNGQIIKDYKRDETEWYDKKWNKKRTKMREEVHMKDKTIIRVYRNNNLIKEKIK